MAFPRKPNALQFSETERCELESIGKSRTEEKRRTLRAAILLALLTGLSDKAIARHRRVSRGTVVLCIPKCLRFGAGATPVTFAARSRQGAQMKIPAIDL
jgi:hypothetical protein